MTDHDQDYRRGPGTGPKAQQWHARQANARKERQQLRDLAVTVDCPRPPCGCGMVAGRDCVSRLPGEPPQPLKRFPAHPARIAAARKAVK